MSLDKTTLDDWRKWTAAGREYGYDQWVTTTRINLLIDEVERIRATEWLTEAHALIAQWRALSPQSAPAPSSEAAAFERGLRRCAADLEDLLRHGGATPASTSLVNPGSTRKP